MRQAPSSSFMPAPPSARLTLQWPDPRLEEEIETTWEQANARALVDTLKSSHLPEAPLLIHSPLRKETEGILHRALPEWISHQEATAALDGKLGQHAPHRGKTELKLIAEGKSVEQIRALIEQLALPSASPNPTHFCLLSWVEQWHHSAQQLLLKLLEEPPTPTHFFLTTQNLARIPSTILSRCTLLQIPRAPSAALSRWLQRSFPNLSASEASSTSRLSHGSPYTALKLLTDKERTARNAAIKQYISCLMQGNFLGLHALLSAPSDTNLTRLNDYLHLLGDLNKLFHEAPEAAYSHPEWKDRLKLLTKQAAWSREPLWQAWRLTGKLFSELSQLPQLNRSLLITYLLYQHAQWLT